MSSRVGLLPSRATVAEPAADVRHFGVPRPSMAALHRTAGNRAIGALIQRAYGCGVTVGAQAEDCHREVQQHRSAGLQMSPRLSHPGDQYEQEADGIADQVMRMTDSAAVQRKCSACAERDEQSSPQLLRKGTSSAPTAPSTLGPLIGSGSGRSLENSTRAFFEPRFGQDFSDVRIHTDAGAAESARSLDALAYTVGSHVVFAPGQYAPATRSGQHLLAHELAHTLQQRRGGSAARMIMGRWDRSPECATAPADPWIKKVVVNQDGNQKATVHWSDGTVDSDDELQKCSAGKGHCCVDPATPGAAACTVAGSHVDGSNCTPITLHNGYLVKNRVRDHRGVKFWTEFVPERGIALHEYKPNKGKPLSHGCVRLDHDLAVKIFCGVRQNQTWVQVHGLPRPSCDDSDVRAEWVADFRTGGTDLSNPPDGVTPASIRETRRELNAAFGRTLTIAEIRALTADDIPRCRS